MKTWLFQDSRQRVKQGARACPWSVGWYDLDGRKRQRRIGTKTQAKLAADKIHAQLVERTYGDNKDTWKAFREKFLTTVASGKAPNTRRAFEEAFARFERLIAPKRMAAITTATIDEFKAKRRQEPSKRRKGGNVSPATVNKELRHLKAAFRKARKWKMIPEVPDIEMERELERIPEYASPEDFAALYEACDTMNRPKGLACEPSEWWRGLLTFAYMTGWRISEILSLRREDVDLEASVAFVEANHTKGKRDARIDLHPVVVAHVRPLVSFEPLVFTWPHYTRALWEDFKALKEAAGVTFSGAFHRLRFGFATVNRGQYDPKVLQRLMRHKAFSTTLKYINVETEVARTADRLFVPDVLKRGAG